jgi:hypothetical protein
MDNRNEIRDFLASRRARITPTKDQFNADLLDFIRS